MRRPRLSEKAWITLKELPRFFKTVSFLWSNEIPSDLLKRFYINIKDKILKSGWNFSFLYLKECSRLVIKFLSGHPELIIPHKGIRVKRDPQGLPVILPLGMRNLLIKRNNRSVQFILSLINVFRVFPTVQSFKLSTIVDDFNGINQILHPDYTNLAIKEVFNRRFWSLKSLSFLKLETASPHGFKALWNCSSDIIALLHNPVSIVNMLLITRFSVINVLLWTYVILLLCIAIPFAILTYFVHGRMLLGRLGVVKDQAGKGRVIGITNYFFQIMLYPLHSFLFNILRGIKEDGTFDQLMPLNKLINESNNGFDYYCFDLSAATDRLPLQLQIYILNQVKPRFGDKWGELLNIEWLTPNGKSKVKYSVGQPMGAYSSWAMLAITHHVIVKTAALMCGKHEFSDYALLGDDIVIKNPCVAEAYLFLMNSLGVQINLSKSVISHDFAEFAKNWKGHNGLNYTPIGPGLILRLIRNYYYLGHVFSELFRLEIVTNYGACLKILNILPKHLLPGKRLALWSIFGLKGSMFGRSGRDVSFLKKSIAFIFHLRSSESIMTRYLLLNTLWDLQARTYHDNVTKLYNEFSIFMPMTLEVSSNNWSLRLFEGVSRFYFPGFWVYLWAFVKDSISLIDSYFALWYKDPSDEWEDFWEMIPESLSVTSVDWTRKRKVAELGSKIKNLFKARDFFFNYENETSDLLIRQPSFDMSIKWNRNPAKAKKESKTIVNLRKGKIRNRRIKPRY